MIGEPIEQILTTLQKTAKKWNDYVDKFLEVCETIMDWNNDMCETFKST